MDSLKIDLKTEDEFGYFKKVIFAIKEKNPGGLNQCRIFNIGSTDGIVGSYIGDCNDYGGCI